MKKSIIVALALIAGLTVKAQDNYHPGFQLGIKGGIGETVGETEDLSKLMSPAAAIDLGYKFTPAFALRADISGWQGKGFYDNNTWGVNFAQIAADCVFDIRGFSGYKYRIFNPYFFVGAGGMNAFNNGAVKENLPDDNRYWEGSRFDYVLRAGLGADFNVSDLVAISLEFAENATSDKFNSKAGDVFDHQMNLLLGLKFNFGQHSGNKADAIASALAAEEAAKYAAEMAAKAKAEAEAAEKAKREAQEKAEAEARAKAEAEAAALAAAAKAIPTYEELKAQAAEKALAADAANAVYFVIGTTNFVSNQTKKVNAIIDYLKANPQANVILCGFADKNTGNPDLNMKLSEGRQQKVSEMFEKAGISSDRISGYWYGDTVQVSNQPSLNRVCIMVTE